MHPTAPSSSCAALVVIDRITWSPCAGQRGRLLRNAQAGWAVREGLWIYGPFGDLRLGFVPTEFFDRLPPNRAYARIIIRAGVCASRESHAPANPSRFTKS